VATKEKTNQKVINIHCQYNTSIYLLFIPPHWKIDTVVIRRSRSNVIISLYSKPPPQQDKASAPELGYCLS
jgi:hypothetical protein